VIGKALRGHRPHGLIYYLYGPGRHEEHTDPHIVAGWRDPAELEPALRPDGRRDFRQLTGLLQQPVTALGDRAPDRPVWHCVARAAPGDRLLSDEEWGQVAAEIMHRTGLAPLGEDDDAVRWVAIRHADDHIHIVATLARQDGGRARLSNDFYRVREACLAVEERFGLRSTAPADRTAGACPTRAETEKAQRRGRTETPREALRREVSTAAAAAGSEEEFFDRLTDAGMFFRRRFSTRNPGEVTGYAVALPDDTTKDGEPVWFSGGRLASDLTLPKLRHRWQSTETFRAGAVPEEDLTGSERAAIWDHAARTCADATRQIQFCNAAGQPAAAADAAWAAADTLHVASSALGSRIIRRAAADYARAARVPYGRLPRSCQAGHGLRRAARLLSAAAYSSHDRDLSQIALVVRLAALAEAVADLRHNQGRAAQAAAARAAAQRLRSSAALMKRQLHPGAARSPAAAGLNQVTPPLAARPRKTARSAADRRRPLAAQPQPQHHDRRRRSAGPPR
jgi:hypothetical protein